MGQNENLEIISALDELEKSKGISKQVLLEALEAAPEADFLDAYEAHKSDIRSAVSTMREMLNAFYA